MPPPTPAVPIRMRFITLLCLAIATTGLIAGGHKAATAAPVDPSVSPVKQHDHTAHATLKFSRAEVTQQTTTSFRLSWVTDKKMTVMVEAAAEQDSRRWKRVGETKAGSLKVDVPRRLADSDRVWFKLTPRQGPPIVVADRSLRLSGAPNFRDLGGYRTKDGRWLAMGRMYRSGDLSRLTEQDTAKLARLGIRKVIDLRTSAERQAAPNRLPSGVSERQINVLGDPFVPLEVPPTVGEAQATARELYRNLITDPTSTQAYSDMVDELTSSRDGRSTVVLCNAGKDRSGWASAIILRLVGVDRATIKRDYLLSNTYLEEQNQAILARLPEQIRPIYTVGLVADFSYLRASGHQVKTSYGSALGYARALDVSRTDRNRLVASFR